MYIFDGAMGTMLQAAGLEEGYCPELFNVERPEVVKNIHAQYLQHGSDVITTNTFGACGLKLEDYDLQRSCKRNKYSSCKGCQRSNFRVQAIRSCSRFYGPYRTFFTTFGQYEL